MPDRLTGIEVFTQAIRTGSLSAAGRAMGMSAAMATRHLDALEDRLGVALVQRTTRRLILTEAGIAFLDRTEPLLVDLRDAEHEASARTIAIEGVIRISAPVSFGVRHVAPLIAGFTVEHPRVRIELGLSDRQVDLLEERWDVAIRVGRLADSGLVARRLASVRLVLCASPAYLARHGTPRTLDDLQAHDCLGYTLGSRMTTTSWAFGRDGERRVQVRGSLVADNGDAIIAAAIAGHGLVYGPRFIAAEGLADGRLIEIDLDVELMDLGAVHAITHPTKRPLARTRAWIEYMVAQLGGRNENF